MKKASLLLLPILSLILVLCHLSTSEAQPPAAAESFQVDGVHSALIFRIRYADMSTFFGRFNEVSGSFAIDETNLANSKFDLRVRAASVDSGNKKRDGHLMSPDFFSAKQYPEISFVSKKIVKNRRDEKLLEVTGDLSLRGVTKTVVAEVTYGGQQEGKKGLRAGVDGKLTIKREDFGITFGEGMLGSEVTIEMGLTGLKK